MLNLKLDFHIIKRLFFSCIVCYLSRSTSSHLFWRLPHMLALEEGMTNSWVRGLLVPLSAGNKLRTPPLTGNELCTSLYHWLNQNYVY